MAAEVRTASASIVGVTSLFEALHAGTRSENSRTAAIVHIFVNFGMKIPSLKERNDKNKKDRGGNPGPFK
jgi:hypothetical protein